jgi:hypothetical protein
MAVPSAARMNTRALTYVSLVNWLIIDESTSLPVRLRYCGTTREHLRPARMGVACTADIVARSANQERSADGVTKAQRESAEHGMRASEASSEANQRRRHGNPQRLRASRQFPPPATVYPIQPMPAESGWGGRPPGSRSDAGSGSGEDHTAEARKRPGVRARQPQHLLIMMEIQYTMRKYSNGSPELTSRPGESAQALRLPVCSASRRCALDIHATYAQP